MSGADLYPAARDLLARLVSFDTTSRLSNLALIAWIEGYLANHGVASRRIASADGDKANLLASIGPAVAGGVMRRSSGMCGPARRSRSLR